LNSVLIFCIIVLFPDLKGINDVPSGVFVLVGIISGLYSFSKSIPYNNGLEYRNRFHQQTPFFFQFLEKVNLSIIHLIITFIMIYVMISATMVDNGKSGLAILIPLSVFGSILLIPYFGLKYIWKKRN
jgi:hypothetical protein